MLSDASGNVIYPERRGLIHDMLPSTLVCRVQETLLSTPRMNEAGLNVTHLSSTHPLSNGEAHGYVYRDDGRVVASINDDMLVDLDQIELTDQVITVGRSIHTPCMSLNSSISAISIYGWRNLSSSDMMHMLQTALQCSYREMMMMCVNIRRFPVTPRQVKRHFDYNEPCRMQAQLHRRSNKRADRDGTRIRISHTDRVTPIEVRNTTIGRQVGGDFIIIANMALLTMVDKATGLPFVEFTPASKGKAGLCEMATTVFNFFKTFKHTLYEFDSDCEKVFNTNAYNQVLTNAGFTVIHASDPGNQQLNGLAENMVKTLKRIALSMMMCARHLPSWFIVYAIKNACWVIRLRNTRRVDPITGETYSATRLSDFTKLPTDLGDIIVAPFGQIVFFLNYKPSPIVGITAQRELISSGRKGIYLFPCDKIRGGIWVYDLHTRKLAQSGTFVFVSEIPSSWRKFSRIPLDTLRQELNAELPADDQIPAFEENDANPMVINPMYEEEPIFDEDPENFPVNEGIEVFQSDDPDPDIISKAPPAMVIDDAPEPTVDAMPAMPAFAFEQDPAGESLAVRPHREARHNAPNPHPNRAIIIGSDDRSRYGTYIINEGSEAHPKPRRVAIAINLIDCAYDNPECDSPELKLRPPVTIIHDNVSQQASEPEKLRAHPPRAVTLSKVTKDISGAAVGSGNGVYCNDFIEIDEEIMTWKGIQVNEAEAQRASATNPAVIKMRKDLFLVPNRNCMASFIQEAFDDNRVNVESRYDFKSKNLKVYATRDIAPGEELFMAYGNEYWLRVLNKVDIEVVWEYMPQALRNSEHYEAWLQGPWVYDSYLSSPRSWDFSRRCCSKDRPSARDFENWRIARAPVPLGEGTDSIMPRGNMGDTPKKRLPVPLYRVDTTLPVDNTCPHERDSIPQDGNNENLDTYEREHLNQIIRAQLHVDTYKRQFGATTCKARRKEVKRIHRIYAIAAAKLRGDDNPTVHKAKLRADWPKWQEAIEAEMKQVREEGCFSDPVRNVPKKGNIIGSMMILQLKRNPDGTINKYKARLVALGNQQTSESYNEISSCPARAASVKLLMSMQAKLGSMSAVLDVKGAYLKTFIQEENQENLYLRLLDGSTVKLLKYLYGLKQAGYQWQQNLTGVLQECGYRATIADPCVFYYRHEERYIYMCIHVDDFFVISSEQEGIDRLVGQLNHAYGEVAAHDGDIHAYLGVQVAASEDGVTLSQPGYVQKILTLFLDLYASQGYQGNHISPLPVKLPDRSGMEENVDQIRYLQVVGSLNYLAQFTRPELLFAVSILAQQCSNPTTYDWMMVQRVLKYLAHTPNIGVHFSRGPIELICFADASHNCYSNGKGHLGYCFSLGHDDGAFHCVSKRIKIVTGSSTESEYVALYEAARDLVWLRGLLAELGHLGDEPTLMWQDNKSTIHFVNGIMNFQATKHINPKYHYSKDLVNDGIMRVEHKSTLLMLADVLTKSMSGPDHIRLSSMILNVPVNSW